MEENKIVISEDILTSIKNIISRIDGKEYKILNLTDDKINDYNKKIEILLTALNSLSADFFLNAPATVQTMGQTLWEFGSKGTVSATDIDYYITFIADAVFERSIRTGTVTTFPDGAYKLFMWVLNNNSSSASDFDFMRFVTLGSVFARVIGHDYSNAERGFQEKIDAYRNESARISTELDVFNSVLHEYVTKADTIKAKLNFVFISEAFSHFIRNKFVSKIIIMFLLFLILITTLPQP